MAVLKLPIKLSRVAIFFLLFSASMAVWQFYRMKEKQSLISVASTNMNIVFALNELPLDLPLFSKVKGSFFVEDVSFSLRKKNSTGVVNRYFSTLTLKDKVIILDLGCSSKSPIHQTLDGTWLVRDIPRRFRLLVLTLDKLSKKTNKELPFLDSHLINSRLTDGVADIYLERIPDGLSPNQLFAMDLSRSEILSFNKTINVQSSPSSLSPCFNIISPPSLHKGYIFEWLFIGLAGAALIQLIASRLR